MSLSVLWAHKIKFGVYNESMVNVTVLILAGFITMSSMGERFRYALFQWMYWLCFVSIVCFIVMRVLGYIMSVSFLSTDSHPGIFLWNVRLNEIILGRNCGPFGEPGAFSGYIIMTFALFFNDLEQLWKEKRMQCIVLIIALITIFSTQGYLTAFVFVMIKLLVRTNSRKRKYNLCFGIVFVFIGGIVYQSTPFLQRKINDKLMLVSDWEDDESILSANRFTTTMIDIMNIERNPLWGKHLRPRISLRRL